MTCYLALVRADLELALFGVHNVIDRLPAVPLRPVTTEELTTMRAVAHRLQAAALYYRPGARCLPQAIAITRLLRWQQHPVTMIVAVRRFPFAAHAWVECEGQVLTDRQDVKLEFNPILSNTPTSEAVVPA
ncbi:MAG: lasso peptide biosynthesis B2 protein [Trueperaceae bacterium]